MYDVIVIGAGAAGLLATRELLRAGKNVIVLEAKDRVGGRMHTLPSSKEADAPLEAGAEFIHGSLQLTLQLLKEAGIPYHKTGGSYLRSKNGKFVSDALYEHMGDLQKAWNKLKHDIPVQDFVTTYFNEKKYAALYRSVLNYVSGYYAADPSRASTLALKEELEAADEDQYRVQGGYGTLVLFLYAECQKMGAVFELQNIAKHINWSKGNVSVTTARGATYQAQKIVVTVPLGILQSTNTEEGSIYFNPAIPKKIKAFSLLGFGSVLKVLLLFDEPFWQQIKGLETVGFLLSDEDIPTWWTQYPQSSGLLVGWCAGPKAAAMMQLSDEVILDKSIKSLATILKIEPTEIKNKIRCWTVCNWAADPFTKGAFSYITVDTKKALQIVKQPEEETLFFAGEAFIDSKEVGTVEAALRSATDVVAKILTIA